MEKNNAGFEQILKQVVAYLKKDAESHPEKYETSGESFEEPVVGGLINILGAANVEYKPGSHAFPDVKIRDQAGKWWGIEVKSSTKESWKINGNSIVGEKRAKDLEDVYVLFGQIKHAESEFRFKRLEDAISGVAVTHSPRFLIDLDQDPNDTLFKHIKMTMHDFERAKDPIRIIADYYLSLGKEAWWLPESSKEEETSPFEIKFFKDLPKDEKESLIGFAIVHYPEVLGSKSIKKYNRFMKYLAMSKSILSPSLRDIFTAGGKFETKINGKAVRLPHVFETIRRYKRAINAEIQNCDRDILLIDWEQVHEYAKIEKFKVNNSSSLFNNWAHLATEVICLNDVKSSLTKGDVLTLVLSLISK